MNQYLIKEKIKGKTYWRANLKEIHKIVAEQKDDSNAISVISNLLLEEMANDRNYMLHFIKKCYKDMRMVDAISINLCEDGTAFSIYFTIDMFLDYYKEHQENLDDWQKYIYKILGYYSSEKYLNKKFSKKIPGSFLTYRDIKTYMTMPLEDFERFLVEYKDIAQELYRVIYYEPENYYSKRYVFKVQDCIYLYRFSESEMSLLDEHLKVLNYYCEPNKLDIEDFHTYDFISSDVSLKKEFIDDIMSGIPVEFDDLQKAYYIYRRLCLKFYYDEEYYCYNHGTAAFKNKEKPFTNHDDIKRLKHIVPNTGMVCHEISTIYSKFLIMLKIPHQLLNYGDEQYDRYGKGHMKVRLKVGELLVDADAGHGIYGSDMSMAKLYQRVHNFTPVEETPKRLFDQFYEKIKIVDEYLAQNSSKTEFQDALEVYENTYADKTDITFMEKVNILKEMIMSVSSPFIVMIGWVNDLKKKIFGRNNLHCHVEFLINNNPTNPNQRYELAMVIIFNEKGNIFENLEDNKYLLITEDHQERLLNCKDFKELIDKGSFDYTEVERKQKYGFEEDSNENKRAQ